MESNKDSLSNKVGFSFAKTSAVAKKKQEPVRDYVTDISGNHITSLAPSRKDGPLVIPIEVQGSAKRVKITPNEPVVIKVEDNKQENGNQEKTLDEMAVEMIISEAKNKPAFVETDKILPIILQNQIEGIENIQDEEERFKYDVQSRPDEADEEAYEQVPIEEFGKAMLRGMGWETGKPIGLNNRGLVEPIEFVARQGRLGLGATPESIEVKKKKYIKPGESRDPKPIMVAPTGPDGKVRHIKRISEQLVPLSKSIVGKLAAISSGPHEGLYVRVLQELPNDEAAVLLLASEEEVVVMKSDLNLTIGEHQLSKDHPALKYITKTKHHSTKSHKDFKSSASTESHSPPSATWLCPHIMVRLISKKFKGGKYYNKKGEIVDVIGKYECVVQLPGGALVEGVQQTGLETVIPKVGGKVMVVNGSSKGLLGTLLEHKKDKNKDAAVIQLGSDFSIATFQLDDIAEYVGNANGQLV